ncbi:MAG: heparan-alpha-glucosaminide N-acetyltransferase domain-containing protein [bacterium]
MSGEKVKSRLAFLDLLRGWAVLVMIEVHVFNAVILPELKSAGWFTVLNYINGLVAPSFIFISGFVFILASQKKLESFRTYGTAFWKQLGRIGLIWVVGYFLHLPTFSFRTMFTQTDEIGWLKFYQSDVLHCIALGLLILFILRLWIRSDRLYQNFLLFGGIGIIILAPFLGDIDFLRYLHPSMAAYLNGLHYSIFPVFPWMAFMLAGGFAATLFGEARRTKRVDGYFKNLLIFGFIFILGGGALRWFSITIPFASLNIRYDPFFFIERLGVVLLLLWI